MRCDAMRRSAMRFDSLASIGIPCFAPNVSCAAAPLVGGSANFPGRSNEVPCPYYVNATIVEQPTPLLVGG